MGKWTPERKAGYLSIDLGPELKARVLENAANADQSVAQWVRELIADTLALS